MREEDEIEPDGLKKIEFLTLDGSLVRLKYIGLVTTYWTVVIKL